MGIGIRDRYLGQFCPIILANIGYGFVIVLCGRARTNLSTLRQSFDKPNSCPESRRVASPVTSRERRSTTSRAGEQAVLAQELPKRPAVFLHCERSAGDVPPVRMHNSREKVMLESLNCAGF